MCCNQVPGITQWMVPESDGVERGAEVRRWGCVEKHRKQVLFRCLKGEGGKEVLSEASVSCDKGFLVPLRTRGTRPLSNPMVDENRNRK